MDCTPLSCCTLLPLKMKVVPPEFVQQHMRKGSKSSQLTPARLQAALALLERVREHRSTKLEEHLASKGSSGLESHETFGNLALKRLKLQPINKNHGRRSSSLQDWGQQLLDFLVAAGFERASESEQSTIIDAAQSPFAQAMHQILEQDPLQARVKGRSAVAVVKELLDQADEKGKAGDVAQYLVGAKLMLRLGIEIPVHQANKGDRKSRSDESPRLGDFEVGDAIIEVALGLPDEKHVQQIEDALDDPNKEVWLLTKADRVGAWLTELEHIEATALRRVVVDSVERFVGQNIAELSSFGVKAKAVKLQELFSLYNERWVKQVGFQGIRIVCA